MSRLLHCWAALMLVMLTFMAVAWAAESPPTATAIDGFSVEVRPLDDPANPYLGQYDDQDRWIVEHWRTAPAEDERQEYYSSYKPEQDLLPVRRHLTFGTVDREGWLIPGAVSRQRVYSDLTVRDQANWGHPKTESEPLAVLWADGPLSKEAHDLLIRESRHHSAAGHPVIPAWLGEHLPLEAVFVPNGEILAYGELGLVLPEDDERWRFRAPPGERWYRYSADGRLLSTHDVFDLNGPSDWRAIYNPGVRDLGGAAADGTTLTTIGLQGGFTAIAKPLTVSANPVFERPQYEILSAVDFLGNPVDLDAVQDPRIWRMGMQSAKKYLAETYAAQVELGLTDPHAQSPWVGTDEGPVLASGSWKPKVVATKGQYPDEEGVLLRGIDDPENPYRGQYAAWDLWLLENVGRQDPKMNEYFNAQYQRLEQLKAKKEGREPDPAIMEERGYPHDPANPWQQFTVSVDAEGFPLPRMVEVRRNREWQRELHPEAPYILPPQEFSLQAGGAIPADMATAMKQAEYAAVQDLYPPIPQWLIEQPVEMAYFTPVGDIVTRGPLGWYTAEAQQLSHAEQHRQVDYVFFRYSPSGDLLGRYDTSEGLPLAYNPNYLSQKLTAEAQGYKTDNRLMYLTVTRPDSREVVNVYDYDGTPLGTEGPFRRDKIAGAGLHWYDLQRVYEAQQAARVSAGGER
jgi:hypothetical protein